MTQGGTSIASRVAEGITQASPISLSRVVLLFLLPVLLLRHVTAETTTSSVSVKPELFYNDKATEPKYGHRTIQEAGVLESKNENAESTAEAGNRSWKKSGRKIRNRDEQEPLNSESDLLQIPTIATIDLEDRSSTTGKEEVGSTSQKLISEMTTPVVSHLSHQSIENKNIEKFGNSEDDFDSKTDTDGKGVPSKPISLLNDTLVNYHKLSLEKDERTDINGSARNSTGTAVHTGTNLLSDNVNAKYEEYQPKQEVELLGNDSYLMTSMKLHSGPSTSTSEIDEESNFFTTILASSSPNPNVNDQKDVDKEKRKKKKKTMAMTVTGDPDNENQDTRSTSSTSINIPDNMTDSDINVSHNESFNEKGWPYPYATSFHHFAYGGKEKTTERGEISVTSPKTVKETLQYGNAIGNQESISKEALDVSSSTVPQPVLTTPSTKPIHSKRSGNFSKVESSTSQLFFSTTTPTVMTTLMTLTSTSLPISSASTEANDNLTQSLTTNFNPNSTSSTVTTTTTTTAVTMNSGNVTTTVTEAEETNTSSVNPQTTSNEIQSDLTYSSPILLLPNVTEPVQKYLSTMAADDLTLSRTTPGPDTNGTAPLATLSPSSTTETVASPSSVENYINDSTNEPSHDAITENETSKTSMEYEFVGLTEPTPSEKYVASTEKEKIYSSTEKDHRDDVMSTSTDQLTETWTSTPNVEATTMGDNDSLVNLNNETLRPRMLETSENEESSATTIYPIVFNSDNTTELYVTDSDEGLNTTTPVIVNSTQSTLNLDTLTDDENVSTLSSISLGSGNSNSQTTDVTIEVSNSSTEFTTISTVDYTVESTVNNTVESTIDTTVGSTINDTVEGTVDNTVGTTVNNTGRATVYNTMRTTVDYTMRSTVESIVENSTSTEITNDSTTTKTLMSTSPVTASTSTSTMIVPRKTVAPEEMTVLVRIVFEGSWSEVCKNLPELQNSLAKLLTLGTEKYVSPYQIVFHQAQCQNTSETSASNSTLTSVLVYVLDEDGNFDANMTELLPSLHKMYPIETALPIHSFLLVHESDSGNAIAVVVVSCVAFICLVLLAGLLFIMRKRQTTPFSSYGRRCRPISLDAYRVDSVSAYNSVRRKGITRASKRSYGNPTFEDSTVTPSHPLNFGGLSTFCNDKNAIAEEYASIPQVSSCVDEVPVGAESKNRYANVIPLPETRVPLQRLNNDPLTEYINASYVRGPKNASKYYIACQAPTESTATDFWRMIWEQQSKVIVMLTDFVENGVEKCTEYLPPSEVTDCHRLYGDYQVTLKKRETKEKYAISTLHLKNLENNTFREIFHIWYLWPSNGVPNDAAGLIAVLLEARALQRAVSGPMVIHCSPGTGRTGTLIALDLGIRQFEVTRTVDVPRVVYTIRRDRAGAVQTKEQYGFIYKALNLYATKLAGGTLESM
ncbi:receptor-type tyrosine-protein phosphatase zeta isoform X2 [Cephus cinctus]|nr:receptor-type tyrosine-protein phosphatase zeta isoform X2 [Cephus cinctus]XP_015596485.1 receptor-type tyrosine-protein phosphatase zeta isoform X2 [Cephus cinctus]XP_024941392.1 receptor-type tyrosine-protein phosphatase zeta isoform X2 [Cephus cinctus]XP_024941393.1 receptor-type tyrosine-protein phosphatase zeta isoform X2 [Cephus cinctus]XP_024941394.1 receptor-type tyrosine-protein phosphatase zeta isoform X2 [Cephus cinctus]